MGTWSGRTCCRLKSLDGMTCKVLSSAGEDHPDCWLVAIDEKEIQPELQGRVLVIPDLKLEAGHTTSPRANVGGKMPTDFNDPKLERMLSGLSNATNITNHSTAVPITPRRLLDTPFKRLAAQE